MLIQCLSLDHFHQKLQIFQDQYQLFDQFLQVVLSEMIQCLSQDYISSSFTRSFFFDESSLFFNQADVAFLSSSGNLIPEVFRPLLPSSLGKNISLGGGLMSELLLLHRVVFWKSFAPTIAIFFKI